MHTPWGPSQSREQLAEGIIAVSTASHGGIYVSPELNQDIPDYMRDGSGWYEEDVAWAIVATVFPEAFEASAVEAARTTMRNYFPNAYEAYYEVALAPGESHARDEAEWRTQNKRNYLTLAAWGDWHKAVPKGYVAVFAGRGGRKRDGSYPKDTGYWLVPEEEYDQRGPFGFVVDPKRHKKTKPIG